MRLDNFGILNIINYIIYRKSLIVFVLFKELLYQVRNHALLSDPPQIGWVAALFGPRERAVVAEGRHVDLPGSPCP